MMNKVAVSRQSYELPIEIAKGIFWIGFYDSGSGLHCNPYLIVDGDEAVVIDGGSRPDFPTVMMKILQAGITPKAISTLIYQHYDPDLCGSIPNLEEMIGRDDLTIVTHSTNAMFIRHYSATSRISAFDKTGHTFTFASGRVLRFIDTPYCHAAGSFVTFDEESGTLFTSDLFGSSSREWDLYLDLKPDCYRCGDYNYCAHGHPHCALSDIASFHREIMTSGPALQLAMMRIADLPVLRIAPQHGSVIREAADILRVVELLLFLDRVGIDDTGAEKRPGEVVEQLRQRLGVKNA